MLLLFSGPQCFSGANQSAEWLEKNFGFFSKFAPITDFYELNPNFSAVSLNNTNTLKPQTTVINLFLVLFLAGGALLPVTKTNSRTAAAASSYSSRERRHNQPSVQLPDSVT